MSEDALLIDVSSNNHVKLTMARSRHRPEPSATYPCRTFEDFSQAVDTFLTAKTDRPLMGAAVSACGWEQDGGLTMPNDSFRIQREWLRDLLKIRRLNLVNDCVCIAMAVPMLRADETIRICGSDGDDTQPKLLIGASFGLGSALIVTDDVSGATILPSEGGHTDLPAISARERAVLEVMVRKFGRVSRERAVSLQGLREIWRCLGVIDGLPESDLSAEGVVFMAQGGDRRAMEAVSLSTGWLAATASDAALMTGARGGIYLAGSMIDLLGDSLDKEAFTDRFQDKGRLSGYVADIPVHIIVAAEPEMIGLSTLFS